MPTDVESPPTDEELPRSARRPWLGLGMLAAALVAGLIATRLAERHDPAPRAAASTAPHSAALPRDAAPRLLDPPTSCPDAGDGQTLCATSSHVPAAVFAAIRTRFPHAHRVIAVEERLRDVGFGPGGVWYRELRATEGRRTIMVVVRHRTADDQPRLTRLSGPGPTDGLQVTRLVHRRAVDVAVSGPHRQLPAFHVVQDLARDPRLLTAS